VRPDPRDQITIVEISLKRPPVPTRSARGVTVSSAVAAIHRVERSRVVDDDAGREPASHGAPRRTMSA
jgi:hypothetical protein